MCLKIRYKTGIYYVEREDREPFKVLLKNGRTGNPRTITFFENCKGCIESIWRLYHNVKNDEIYIYTKMYNEMKNG